MSLRKIVATFALLIGCVVASLATPASAFAADSQHTTTSTVAPAACSTPNHRGALSTVAITLCGSTATAIGAQVWINFYGHLQFYGPHGVIANTADRQFLSGDFVTIPINQSAPSGSLWCVKLWERSGSGYVQLDNNCVSA